MDGQLSIFDWMPDARADSYPAIDTITEAEAAAIVGQALGLTFRYNDFFKQWETEKGPLRLHISYSHYTCRDLEGILFIGVGWSNHRRNEGGSAPRDSIQDAIAYFERRLNTA